VQSVALFDASGTPSGHHGQQLVEEDEEDLPIFKTTCRRSTCRTWPPSCFTTVPVNGEICARIAGNTWALHCASRRRRPHRW